MRSTPYFDLDPLGGVAGRSLAENRLGRAKNSIVICRGGSIATNLEIADVRPLSGRNSPQESLEATLAGSLLGLHRSGHLQGRTLAGNFELFKPPSPSPLTRPPPPSPGEGMGEGVGGGVGALAYFFE